jgi:hypothetical protein
MTTSTQRTSQTASGPGFNQLSQVGPDRIEGAYQSDLSNPNRLQPQAQQYVSNVLSGQYLNPASNPHLSGLTSAIWDQVAPNVNSVFGRGGRTGSTDHAGALSRGFTSALAPHLFNQYNVERGFQHQGAQLSPALDASGNLPLEQYLERMRNLSTLSQKGQTSSTPSTLQTLAGIGLTAAGMFGAGPAGMGLKIPGMGV